MPITVYYFNTIQFLSVISNLILLPLASFYINYINLTNNGTNTSDTIDINLIKIFNEGPDVSLNGSPTVSPTTAVSYTHLDVYKRQVYHTSDIT